MPPPVYPPISTTLLRNASHNSPTQLHCTSTMYVYTFPQCHPPPSPTSHGMLLPLRAPVDIIDQLSGIPMIFVDASHAPPPYLTAPSRPEQSGKGKCVQSDWVPRRVKDRPFGGVEIDDNEQPVLECRCANKKKSWDEELLKCIKPTKNGRAGANRGE